MWNAVKQFRGLHWMFQFGFGALSTLAAIALTLYLLIIFGPLLTPRPLSVIIIESGVAESVCPGDAIVTLLDFKLDEAAVIQFDFSITDAGAGPTHLGTLRTLDMPYAKPTQFTQPIGWVVPDLPAGSYEASMAFWGRGTGGDPFYVVVPFTIRPGCTAVSWG